MNRNRKLLGILGIVAVLGLATACTSSAERHALDGNEKLQEELYQPVNNIEFNNYNERLRIADDPTTLLWCTLYYSNPNVRPITVPFVGKVTSSEKRPFASVNGEGGENPDPNYMYGSSVPYRFGFTPAGVYFDFTDVESVCTTQPTTYQATETTIVMKVDDQLNAAANAARDALKAGMAEDGTISPEASAAAQDILENATGQ